jgi:hypothetical protein
MHLFETSRSRFVDPLAPGTFCVGGTAECGHFGESVTWLKWNLAPPASQTPEIRVLHICPTPSQVKKKARLPEYVQHLSNLKTLVVPAPYLAELSPEHLPPSLRSLGVDLDPRWIGERGQMIPTWSPSLRLPLLKGLSFFGTYGAAMFWPGLGWLPDYVPGLTFFLSDIDSRGDGIEQLSRLSHIRHLELGNLGELDPFSQIKHPIEFAALSGGGRNFPFSKIGEWTDLRSLVLTGIRSLIDCQIFTGLPALTELKLVSCKNLHNLERLLECKNLRILDATDCGRPFSKSLSQAFTKHDFSFLDIRFA